MWVKGYCLVTADTRKANSSASWKPGIETFTVNISLTAGTKESSTPCYSIEEKQNLRCYIFRDMIKIPCGK